MAEERATAEPIADPNWPRDAETRMGRIGGAEMDVTVRLGKTSMPLEDVLNVEPGTLIEVDRLSGEPVDVIVNGQLFGRGEIVVIGDHLAVRINSLLTPEQMANA